MIPFYDAFPSYFFLQRKYNTLPKIEAIQKTLFKKKKRRDDGGGGITREEYGVGSGSGPGGPGANSARGGGSGYHNPHHRPGAGGSSNTLGGTRPPVLARMTGEDFLAPLRDRKSVG